ncbi:MAG: response regulator transcription factor [Acidobacteriota bacterium]
MSSKIRILVAEDHMVARVGITAIINRQKDMIVIAEATNGQQAVTQFSKLLPDIAVLDMRMPFLSGADAASAILSRHPAAKLIALSTFGGDEGIRRAMDSGMHAYLTKDVLHDELLQTIRDVHAGKKYLPEALAFALQLQSANLSDREIEVLRLIASGLANKQIAHSLRIAEPTVKNHLRSIFGKLGVQDRTEAAIAAIQRGIVQI